MNEMTNKTKKVTQRALQAQNRRQQLLESAMRVFAEKGFHQATTRDLAAAAEVAEGLFYHYFPSKEALLLEIVESSTFLNEMAIVLANAGSLPTDELLTKVGLGFSEVLKKNRALIQIYFSEAARIPQIRVHLQGMIGMGVSMMTDFLRQRMEKKEIQCSDPEIAARTFLYSIFLNGYFRPDEDHAHFVKHVVATLMEGLNLPD